MNQIYNDNGRHAIVLSAGTDGVDGNSPAAGAIADETTVKRANEVGLDATRFVERSDSYTFFETFGGLMMTGPTGTNVRDLRVLIRSRAAITVTQALPTDRGRPAADERAARTTSSAGSPFSDID